VTSAGKVLCAPHVPLSFSSISVARQARIGRLILRWREGV
jgi:hypothetical protein